NAKVLWVQACHFRRSSSAATCSAAAKQSVARSSAAITEIGTERVMAAPYRRSLAEYADRQSTLTDAHSASAWPQDHREPCQDETAARAREGSRKDAAHCRTIRVPRRFPAPRRHSGSGTAGSHPLHPQ